MQEAANTYLKYIDLVLLENWSVQGLLDAKFNYSNKYEQARIGDFLIKSRNIVNIEDDEIAIISISCETKYPQELIKMIKDNMQNMDIKAEMRKFIKMFHR